MSIWHWIVAVSGARDETGGWYGLWSGLGGSIPDVMILAAMAGWYWHRTCEVHRCWRIGRHKTAAGHAVCRRHHPAPAPTAQDVADAHWAAQRRQ